MKFEIFDGEKLVNTILANENFAKDYCAENGYTYKEILHEVAVSSSPAPTLEERTAALEAAMLSMMGVSADV